MAARAMMVVIHSAAQAGMQQTAYLLKRLDGILANIHTVPMFDRHQFRVEYATIAKEIERRRNCGFEIGRVRCANCKHYVPNAEIRSFGVCEECEIADWERASEEAASMLRAESGYGSMRPADYMTDPRDWGMDEY